MYKPIILPYFRRQLQPYVKKYRHLKEAVISSLEKFQEAQHHHLGSNVYKVRVRTKDIPRGKSKQFRLIVLLAEIESYIVPITVYFKGGRKDMSKKEINRHLENILFGLHIQRK